MINVVPVSFFVREGNTWDSFTYGMQMDLNSIDEWMKTWRIGEHEA